MKTSPTYQRLSKATAVLLLMAFLVPSGLHAKQLADYCMMEMDHHQKTEMANDHNGCDEEAPASHQEGEHDCEGIAICACNIGQSFLDGTEWTFTSNKYVVFLKKQFDTVPIISSDESIYQEWDKHLNEHSPPFWLLYDTLLM